MRRLVGVLAAAFVLVPLVGVSAASATPVDLTCQFTATFTATPGVSLVQQAQTIGGTVKAGTAVSPLTPCVSLLTGIPYKGGTATVTGTGFLGCLVGPAGLIGNASVTLTATWDTGAVSTIAGNIALGPIPSLSGSVTAGAMEGSSVLPVPAPTGFQGLCGIPPFFPPVTQLSGAGVVVFLQA